MGTKYRDISYGNTYNDLRFLCQQIRLLWHMRTYHSPKGPLTGPGEEQIELSPLGTARPCIDTPNGAAQRAMIADAEKLLKELGVE